MFFPIRDTDGELVNIVAFQKDVTEKKAPGEHHPIGQPHGQYRLHIQRVTSQATRHVDTRVIATINVSLEQALAHGNFRQDLYFRLSVVVINIPPLRDQREDSPALCDHFLALLAPW